MAEDRRGDEKAQEERGFSVVDRRHGRESAEERSEGQPAGGSDERARREPPRAAPPPPPSEAPREPRPAEGAGAGASSRGETGAGGGEMPAMDFATFLISLSTSALYHMGLVPEREGGEPPPANLPMARQTIDILELLQAKTRGNLDDEEAHLLESLLYELRMRYVEVQRG